MYFIEQLKKQLLSNARAYQETPEGPGDTVEPSSSGKEIPQSEAQKLQEIAEAARGAGDSDPYIFEQQAAVESAEESEIKPLSSQEVFSSIEFSSDAEKQARAALGEDASPEQIQELKEQVFQDRLEALANNTISDGEREILESEFIAEISQEAGIDAQLVESLKALGFEGSQDWDSENIAENLRELTQQLKSMREQIEADGGEFPITKEEFLALWEHMEAETFHEAPLDTESLEEMGIPTVTDSQGNTTIDPTAPGYTQQAGGTVMGPPGAPYSVAGNTYAGEESYISPDAGNITYEGLSGFEKGELSENQINKLDNKEHKELIENRFPEEYYEIAIAFVNTERTIDESKPIALASMPDLTAIVSYPGNPIKIEEAPISIGINGYGPSVRADGEGGAGVPGDRRTQSERVFHFNSASIAGVGNQARPPSRSILGASIQSPEGADKGGRWWHGGRDGRFPGQNSYGCVVANQEFMIRLANAVQAAGGGYGYNSSLETGNIAGGETPTTRT